MQFDPAMADLAALRERRLATPDPGARPIIRSITPDDGPALTEMALRCSPDSIRHRFHAPLTGAEPSRLTAFLRGRGAIITLVADVDGAVVGIATLHRSGRGAAEVAVLVEDHSVDDTRSIARDLAATHPWLEVLDATDHGEAAEAEVRNASATAPAVRIERIFMAWWWPGKGLRRGARDYAGRPGLAKHHLAMSPHPLPNRRPSVSTRREAWLVSRDPPNP